MKNKIIPVIAALLIICALASCSLPHIGGKNITTDAAETDTALTETSSEADSMSNTDETVTTEKTTKVSTESVKSTVTAITEKTSTTVKKVVTTLKKVTTTLRAASTTRRVSTTAKTTGANNATSSYEGTTSTSTNSYRSDLKYGVDLIVYVNVYYAKTSSGKRYKVGEKETARRYDRSTYTASYSDLLPAAKANRQTYASYINRVLELTNAMRAEKGIAPLTLDDKLTEQANVRAEEVAWSGQHTHLRPNFKEYSSLFIDNGYKTGTIGENLGWYYSTPEEVCAAWKASESHYENIMNPTFVKIGIGVAAEPDPTKNLCWVQHFYS